jgi:hypothetical protein
VAWRSRGGGIVDRGYTANLASACLVSPCGDSPFCCSKRTKNHQQLTGCGSQNFRRALVRRSKILTAAPAPAPCFRRRRRSPSQQGAGPTAKGPEGPFGNPKEARGAPHQFTAARQRVQSFLRSTLAMQNASTAARRIFSLRRLFADTVMSSQGRIQKTVLFKKTKTAHRARSLCVPKFAYCCYCPCRAYMR